MPDAVDAELEPSAAAVIEAETVAVYEGQLGCEIAFGLEVGAANDAHPDLRVLVRLLSWDEGDLALRIGSCAFAGGIVAHRMVVTAGYTRAFH